MKDLRRRDLCQAAALALAWPAVRAQGYPSRTVQVLVGFAAGGPLDVVTRLVCRELSADLGHAFVVENRTGASGQLATDHVAKAPADGRTLLSTASTFVVNPLLIRRQQPDPIADFVPVSLMARLPTMLVVAATSPVRTVGELIATARARGGATYSSAGVGGPAHLAGALLAKTTGTTLTHIPYRGAAPALLDVIGGRVDFTFYTMTGLREQAEAGHVRPLAITAAERHPLFPEAPTMSEAGIDGFDHVGAWFGMVAPAGVPAGQVALLGDAIARSLAKDEVRQALDGLGVVPVGSTGPAFGRFLKQETTRWGDLIRELGLPAS